MLQPNQYHSKKTFSPREQQIALGPEHPYSRAVSRLYPRLVERSRELLEGGVAFLDATGVFDEVRVDVYSDSCCHYNDVGNRILVDLIVKEIGRDPNRECVGDFEVANSRYDEDRRDRSPGDQEPDELQEKIMKRCHSYRL